MTGFSAKWLALREPADHAARNREVLAATSRFFAGRETIDVLDLGSGSGSNLRGLAPHLPQRQNWRLVDYDSALIKAAEAAMAEWTRPNGHSIDVTFQQADLSDGVEAILQNRTDLVTAAAFFDLVSAQWIERFVAILAARQLPLYTSLIYNGDESWDPPHPTDDAVNAAFNLHQRTDKGFGPAAGPMAAEILAAALRHKGYEVFLGDSPWRLGQADHRLIEPLVAGIAQAAAETGKVAPQDLRAWRQARSSPTFCVVGHTDLLAIPPR
jgi:SAM-dependent methyltransferase